MNGGQHDRRMKAIAQGGSGLPNVLSSTTLKNRSSAHGSARPRRQQREISPARHAQATQRVWTPLGCHEGSQRSSIDRNVAVVCPGSVGNRRGDDRSIVGRRVVRAIRRSCAPQSPKRVAGPPGDELVRRAVAARAARYPVMPFAAGYRIGCTRFSRRSAPAPRARSTSARYAAQSNGRDQRSGLPWSAAIRNSAVP
jgi:hypothetical protein